LDAQRNSITLRHALHTVDHIYDDRVIDSTVIDEPNMKLSGVQLLAEVGNGQVTRFLINKYIYTINTGKWQFSRKIAILNPYQQIF